MKKSVKIILIVLAVAIVLVAVGAYILVFRTPVTADFYVSHGDSAMERGNYSAAVRWYSGALKLDKTDPAVAVRLAEAYRGDGNYTKAEYTLVSAITKDPTLAELYIALSETYVEQGKFLDADRMLTRIADDGVREKLEAMRPEPPTLTPDSGYYATYITVTATAPSGTIYVTATGDCPSDERDRYEQPLELPLGETTVCAIAVDENGLVSPIRYAGYTVAGVIEPVTLTDPVLDAAVREALGKQPEDTLMTNELWNIAELSLDGVADVSQLKLLTGLTRLDVQNTTVSDFTVVRELHRLTALKLSGCVLSADTVNAIGEITGLTELELAACAIGSAVPLQGLTKLVTLDLSNNNVSDLTPLGLMTVLETLKLHNCPVTDISPVAKCAALREIDLSGCGVTSLKALEGMKSLETLNASDNELTDIAALSGCEKLQKLNISANHVTDVSAAALLPELSVLDASYNELTELPQFEKSSKLQAIHLNYNAVTSVEGLRDLPYLNYVYLDYNEVADLTPLAGCANLVQVDAWGNPIASGVAELQEHSIIVNYNPNP